MKDSISCWGKIHVPETSHMLRHYNSTLHAVHDVSAFVLVGKIVAVADVEHAGLRF